MTNALARTVALALAEDIGRGDVTTSAVVSPDVVGCGRLVSREPMVMAGLDVAAEVFSQVDERLEWRPAVRDGDEVATGALIGEIEGPLRGLLTGERVALNFLQRLCGIATGTRTYVRLLADRSVRLVDTRKTTPGLRALEKQAVVSGGGHNHRGGLDDGVMIKDNHIVAAGGITVAVQRALSRCHHLLAIQVEVDTLVQAHEAVDAGARVLLLDNFPVPLLAAAVEVLRERPESLVLEASGGIRLDSVVAVADTGVDVISCGALVHQARWVDIGLDLG